MVPTAFQLRPGIPDMMRPARNAPHGAAGPILDLRSEECGPQGHPWLERRTAQPCRPAQRLGERSDASTFHIHMKNRITFLSEIDNDQKDSISLLTLHHSTLADTKNSLFHAKHKNTQILALEYVVSI